MGKVSKSIAAAVLVLTFLFIQTAAVFAEEGDEAATDFETMLQQAYDVIPETNSLEGWPQGPQVYGNSAIVMDMNSGAVLYGKKVDDRHYPASITKLLTALVALENSSLDDEVYFSEDSISFLEYGDASIGMTPGEILSMEDALYGMLLASANEVSYAIAENVGKLMGGDYSTFISRMNERAEEIGCTGSHWVNANGLHDEQHYTTAHDMAVIGSAVYQFEEFRKITQTLNYTIGTTNLMDETRTFQQNHKMLWPDNQYYYEFCTGGKTGYTDQAKTTLVTMADNGSLQLVAVLLEDQSNVYDDTKAMLDYVFNNFSKISLDQYPLPDGILSYNNGDAYVVLPEGIDFSSLEHEIVIDDAENAEGTITFYYEGQNVGSAQAALTAEYVEEETGTKVSSPEIRNLQDDDGNTEQSSAEENDAASVVKTLLTVCGAAVVLLIAAAVVLRQYVIRRRRKRRQMKQRRRKNTSLKRSPGEADRRRSRGHQAPGKSRQRMQKNAGNKTGRNRYEPHIRNRDGRYY